MLICYWDIRNLRENVDLVADLLSREQPDLLILQNIGNYDFDWSSYWPGEYDDQRLYTTHTISQDRSIPDNSIPSGFTNTAPFKAGILLIGKNDVLTDQCRVTPSDWIERRLVIDTKEFSFMVCNIPSYGYTQNRHGNRLARENQAYIAPPEPGHEGIKMMIGNFAITRGNADLHPLIRRYNQPLSAITSRNRFNTWLATGWHDMYREFQPTGGYYNAWKRSKDGRFRNSNVGARTSMVIANQALRLRITRVFHLERYKRTHNCPIAVYVKPLEPKGTQPEVSILIQPSVWPPAPIWYHATVTITLYFETGPYNANALNCDDPNAPTVQWYKNGEVLQPTHRFYNTLTRGGSSSVLTIYWAQPGDSGVYHCVLKNTHNTVTSNSVSLTVDPPLPA